MFGAVFVSTVRWFPKGIFVLALSAIAASLGFMMLIRLPTVPMERERDLEATLVVDAPRDTKRVGKVPAVVIDEA